MKARPHDWDEAMDALADEKSMLWDALDNLVSLWDFEADIEDMENSFARARRVLNLTRTEESCE